MAKRIFKRSEAIKILDDLFDPDYMDESDRIDYTTWSNGQLEGELCCSGYIHDEDMGGVVN